MTRFVSGKQLNEAVRTALQGTSACCAVAFWGRGAGNLFGSTIGEARIVCNLESGATNPEEIENLRKRPGFQVRQCDILHAKIYIGDKSAVITSANASANGLGLEANEQEGWIEAGAIVDDMTDIRIWFDTLWGNNTLVRHISDEDIKRARAMWKLRRTWRPSVRTFSQFDSSQARLPLLVWYQDSEWGYDEDNIKKQVKTDNIDEIKERIDWGHDPESKEDEAILKDRWILNWQMTSRGRVSKRSRPHWIYLGHQILRNAWHWSEEPDHKFDVVLTEDSPPPIPFLVNADARFMQLFSKLIVEDRYAPLRSDDAGWKVIDATGHQFWKELHQRYVTT